MKHAMKFLLLLVAGLLALTGCTAAPLAGDLMAGVQAAARPAQTTLPDQAYQRAVSRFAWNLLLQAQAAKPDTSVLISPASVFLALSMALNGADGQTRTAILQALSAADLSAADLNRANRDWMSLLEQTDAKTELFIANSIWLRDSFAADPDFLQINADFYRAGARKLDFNQPSAVQTINDWVKTVTRNKIDSIVESIGSDVVMYLINAVYFKSDWQQPFAAADSRDKTFQTPDGPVMTRFMHRTGAMEILAGDDGPLGVWLPYSDPSYGFFAILPDAGQTIDAWLAEQSASDLRDMIASRTQASVRLALPRFELRYEDSLVDDLTALGMGIAFTGDADFSRMNADRARNLLISDVRHKAFCRVDEKGSEAAAVTSVEVSLTSLPVSDLTLEFDRPFIFGIADARTNLPIFIGILVKPEF
jgi:serpin B